MLSLKVDGFTSSSDGRIIFPPSVCLAASSWLGSVSPPGNDIEGRGCQTMDSKEQHHVFIATGSQNLVFRSNLPSYWIILHHDIHAASADSETLTLSRSQTLAEFCYRWVIKSRSRVAARDLESKQWRGRDRDRTSFLFLREALTCETPRNTPSNLWKNFLYLVWKRLVTWMPPDDVHRFKTANAPAYIRLKVRNSQPEKFWVKTNQGDFSLFTFDSMTLAGTLWATLEETHCVHVIV